MKTCKAETPRGMESLGAQVRIKHLEELLDHSRISKPFSKKGYFGGIWNSSSSWLRIKS